MGTILKAILGAATGGLGSILTWMLEHWRLVLSVLAVAALVIAFKVILIQRDDARSQVTADGRTISELTSQKWALQGNVNKLTMTVEAQSRSIDGLHTASDAAQATAQKAMQEAEARGQKDAATIADLRKRGADQSNGGTCDAEIAHIRAGL